MDSTQKSTEDEYVMTEDAMHLIFSYSDAVRIAVYGKLDLIMKTIPVLIEEVQFVGMMVENKNDVYYFLASVLKEGEHPSILFDIMEIDIDEYIDLGLEGITIELLTKNKTA